MNTGHNFNVGDRVRIHPRSPNIRLRPGVGTIVDVLYAGFPHSAEVINKYYGPNCSKPGFSALVTSKLDRIVVQRDGSNGYLIMPAHKTCQDCLERLES